MFRTSYCSSTESYQDQEIQKLERDKNKFPFYTTTIITLGCHSNNDIEFLLFSLVYKKSSCLRNYFHTITLYHVKTREKLQTDVPVYNMEGEYFPKDFLKHLPGINETDSRYTIIFVWLGLEQFVYYKPILSLMLYQNYIVKICNIGQHAQCHLKENENYR